jgi:hypothetical protein
VTVCGAFYALELQALRQIRIWDLSGKKRGKSLVRYLITACVFLLAIRVSEGPYPRTSPEFVQTWYGKVTGNFARAAVLDTLAAGSASDHKRVTIPAMTPI